MSDKRHCAVCLTKRGPGTRIPKLTNEERAEQALQMHESANRKLSRDERRVFKAGYLAALKETK